MNAGHNRVFLGLGILVVVWIVVYWAWPPREPAPVTYDLPPAAAFPEDEAPPPDRPLASERSALPLPSRVVPPPPLPATDPTPDLTPQPDPAPESAPPPGPRVIAPEFYDYTIRAGDTFERIAARELGDSRLHEVIARANPLKDPRRLRIGEVLRIPRDPANIQGIAVTPPTTPPATPPATPDTDPTPSPAPVEYVVRSGDTLSGISQQFYGTSRHWERIFHANRAILSSPEALREGQTLVIPPPPGS